MTTAQSLYELLTAKAAERHFDLVEVVTGVLVNRWDMLTVHGMPHVRQFTAEGRGGGFVALNSYLPEDIALPWDWYVYPRTRILESAGGYMCNQGPRLVGNTWMVSESLEQSESEDILGKKIRRLVEQSGMELLSHVTR